MGNTMHWRRRAHKISWSKFARPTQILMRFHPSATSCQLVCRRQSAYAAIVRVTKRRIPLARLTMCQHPESSDERRALGRHDDWGGLACLATISIAPLKRGPHSPFSSSAPAHASAPTQHTDGDATYPHGCTRMAAYGAPKRTPNSTIVFAPTLENSHCQAGLLEAEILYLKCCSCDKRNARWKSRAPETGTTGSNTGLYISAIH